MWVTHRIIDISFFGAGVREVETTACAAEHSGDAFTTLAAIDSSFCAVMFAGGWVREAETIAWDQMSVMRPLVFGN